MMNRVIAVLAKPSSPALAAMPASVPGCTLKVCNDGVGVAALNPPPDAIVWIPPCPVAGLVDAWPTISPSVKWFHSFSAGVDMLAPFFEASQLGSSNVLCSNGRGAFSESLAEYVLWAMLHHNKQTEQCLANRSAKRWDNFIMPQLLGKTVGFLGFGHIAQKTAPLCRALGMRVLALRNSDAAHPLADETLSMSGPSAAESKRRVFAECDFVVSTLPGTPATHHFCDAPAFAAMKPSGVFISLGRGMAVDESALAAALTDGRIAGAACDVFETEPLPQDSPLWSCPNMLMTAHNADLTEDYFQLGWGVWKQNLDVWMAGGGPPLATPFDPRQGY